MVKYSIIVYALRILHVRMSTTGQKWGDSMQNWQEAAHNKFIKEQLFAKPL